MSGSGVVSGGQQLHGRQSATVGQPALKENMTVESCGSKPSGGSLVEGLATSESVYVEKSPDRSSCTLTTFGAALVPAETERTLTCDVAVPPVICTSDGPKVRERASFSNVIRSCWPQPSSPFDTSK